MERQSITQQITTLRRQIQVVTERLNDAKEAMGLVEAGMMLDLVMSGEYQKLASNEPTRKLRFAALLQDDQQYAAAARDYAVAGKDKSLLDTELECLRDMRRQAEFKLRTREAEQRERALVLLEAGNGFTFAEFLTAVGAENLDR